MTSSNSYATSGVDTDNEDLAMTRIKPMLLETFKYNNDRIQNIHLNDHYAAVIQISKGIGIAIKTDGVGTKTFVAQIMDKYDTIGIDCIAMNVNDIICTGATPTTFLDYLALQKSDPDLIYEIVKGLKKGADIAKVSIVGGETAIMPDMIKGAVGGKQKGFDLAGTAMGIIDPNKIISGLETQEGDILVGISSSGIHSNGLSHARRALELEKNFDQEYDGLDGNLGQELLKPTEIYVDEILSMISADINLKVVAHITSHGLLNLRRIGEGIGYRITNLPEPQPIYKLIQEKDKERIDIAEMYKVYNMGIGMCVVVTPEQTEDTLKIARKNGKNAFVLGEAESDEQMRIKIPSLNLVSEGDRFIRRF
jgi:phosphoribosylformylglycinamidine cyclo-ligase